MEYPTKELKEHIKCADRYTICKWYRHLHPADNDSELEIMNLIVERYNKLGGFTPEISKAIGW